MVIGICGKSGSGKSTLARQIASEYEDAVYVDIDSIGHDVLNIPDIKLGLINAFGNSVVKDGSVNRKVLSNLVFGSRKNMQILTSITWEPMKFRINQIINSNRNRIVILDWALLSTTEFFSRCDLKVLLDIPYEVRKERAMLRDSISAESFDLRESASIDFKREDFDYVLEEDIQDFVKGLVKLL